MSRKQSIHSSYSGRAATGPKRFFIPLILSLLCFTGGLCAQQQAPDWWGEYSVTNANPADDTAVATLGQGKYVAYQAYLAFENKLPGGAGQSITSMVNATWFQDTSNNNLALKVGVLKYMAALYYDRLSELNVDYSDIITYGVTQNVLTGSETYPWTSDTDPDPAIDKTPALIGQLKFVFSYIIPIVSPGSPGDLDGDGFLDAWEWTVINTDLNDEIETLADVMPAGDLDSDGASNLVDADPLDPKYGEIAISISYIGSLNGAP